MSRWASFLFALILLCEYSSAQVVRLFLDGSADRASAVCIGRTDDDSSVFVTAGHNFEKTRNGTISGGDGSRKWPIHNVRVDSRDDVAMFETEARFDSLPLYQGSLPVGSSIRACGYGREYWGQTTGGFTHRGTLQSLNIARLSSGQVIPGDSGGAVAYQNSTVGIINGFCDDDHRDTFMTPASAIHVFLTRYYESQCPPGGCPVYIRRQVRQPIVGVGIPIGPPQIVTEVRPAPRPVPEPSPQRGEQGPAGQRGERGERGPAGERGPEGPGVSKEHVEAVVAAWLDANRDQLRGDRGERGERGQPGSQGERGQEGLQGERGLIGVPSEAELQAVIETWINRNDAKLRVLVAEVVQEQLRKLPPADTRELESRLSVLEKRSLKVIVTEGGQIRDEEEYQPGEPVVLDIERLRNRSNVR